MKILHKILLILILLCCLTLGLFYDAYVVEPRHLSVRYENLSSMLIPQQMDDVSILFFSDLNYGTFTDETRLKNLTETINRLSPDVILFGGDLLDQDYHGIDTAVEDLISSYLAQMEAPLGKFAVLGDFDYLEPDRSNTVRSILYNGNFEVLYNSSVLLRDKGSESITLVGLDSGLLGYCDVDSAYANVSRTAYTITVCHTPDSAQYIPNDLTNYCLSGHSLGGQVYYGFKAMYAPEMAVEYLRGKHQLTGFTLDITNGVGTTGKDVRLFAPSEVVLYRLHHLSITDAQ